MIWRVIHAHAVAPPHPVATEDDPPPRRDNLHATAQAAGMAISRADSAMWRSRASPPLRADPATSAFVNLSAQSGPIWR
jgi:hypothetical protein